MVKNSLRLLVLGALNIVAGLALESWGGSRGWRWTEFFVDVVTAFHFFYYVYNPPVIGGQKLTRVTLIACLLLATLGELILSGMWGLYKYRVSLLPLFVPPGHVLLFLAGLTISRLKICTDKIVWIVPLFASVFLGYRFWYSYDWLSFPLFVTFLACIHFGRERKLYAVMFVLALLLEFLGTALQTWRWVEFVPPTYFHSANPPLAAGVFYALLDLLTMGMSFKRNVELNDSRTVS
jgi:hypothetical protein